LNACRFCGCTELLPCVDRHDPDIGEHPCFWINALEDVCSACRYHPIGIRCPRPDEVLANYPGLVLTTRGSIVPLTDIRGFDE